MILALAAYSRVWTMGWIYDDWDYGESSPSWLTLALTPAGLFPFALANWWGDGLPWPFHGLVLVLHLLNGLLLWTCARRWLSSPASLLVLLLFWLHPLQVGTVAYITGGREVLLTAYVLAGAIGILAGRRWSIALGLLSLGVALTVKASAMPLVVVAPLVAGSQMQWTRRTSLFAGAVVGATAWWFLMPMLSAVRVDLAFGACLAALWRYLAMIVWPVGFSVEHEPASHVAAYLAIAGTAVFGGMAWRWRARWAAPWCAWLWIVGLILPRGVAADAPLAERHLYLPLIAVWLLIGAALDRRLLS
jgi:hypothetical protein